MLGCSVTRDCSDNLADKKFMEGYSKLHIPISVGKVELEEFVNARIPDTLYTDDNAGGQGVELEIFKNGHPSLSVQGRSAFITLPLSIKAKRNMGFFSARATGALFITLKTDVEIDKNWKWTTETTVVEVNWVEEPKLKMAGMTLSVKNMVDKYLASSGTILTEELDRQLTEKQPLQKLLSDVHPHFQRAYALDPDGTYYLQIVPDKAGISSLIEEGGQLSTQVVIEATTSMLKDSAQTVSNVPTPEFAWADGRNSDHDLMTHLAVPEAEIAELLIDNLRGQEFLINKKRVKIKQVYFNLQDEKIKVETILGGSVGGKVYFEGRPFWDQRRGAMRFCDQEVDIRIDRGISKALLWIGRGRIEALIARKLEEGIEAEIKKRITEINTYLFDFHPSSILSMSAEIYDYSIDPILVRDRSLNMGLNINVRGEVSFEGLKFTIR